jgi:glycogen operon protein
MEKDVVALRQRQKRNFLTTLFLSQGVPMMLAGDEMSRTQKGNNNAYCQDNDISWVDWKHADQELIIFTRQLIALRRSHPSFTRKRWFQGQPIKGIGVEDIAWFLPEGTEMTDDNWNHSFAKSLGLYLNGRGLHSLGPKEEPFVDDSFYIIFNAHHEDVTYVLPEKKYSKHWVKVLNTAEPAFISGENYKAGDQITVEGRSIILLKNPKE